MDITKHQSLLQSSMPLSPTTTAQKQGSVAQEGLQKAVYFSDRNEKEKVKQMVESVNEFLKPVRTSLQFQFHDKLGEYYVTVVDNETREVVKEVPPKKLLDMYAAIAEKLGFLVDHKI
ncbi:flagellar protein FlaG [Halobacillus sp. ACCC02827]|uniref:flagellar protein FlaG n=1 Tax=Bacillaceae TaxID=186817 RepID=UPI0004279802|nr:MULTISPECIES: flagellar protein FlaG [Bacillaceae]WJE14914.1 flagellar protein FlaG [Halobacillus sp. ACCC02827]